MEKRLIEAAEAGDIDALYLLIKKDPFILEKVDKIPFVHTPLHIAVLFGNTRFAMEILRLMPSFSRKLNQDGFSPIHLASTKGNVIMVRKLIDFDRELCFLKGRESRNPLHCAAIAGKVHVIDELFSSNRENLGLLGELTVGDETALHLAVKNKQLEAFNVILGWIEEFNKMALLKLKDEEGNTILHLATSTNQDQVVETLVKINNSSFPLDINAKNASGLTALDILQQLPRELDTWEIRKMLRRANLS